MKKNFIHRLMFRYIPIITGTVVGIFLLLLMAPRPIYITGFTAMDSLVAYVKTTNENIQMDTDNTIKPEFGSYYKTLIPTWENNLKEKITWLLSFLKLTQVPQWSPSFFKYQIETLAILREVKGYKDSFICKISPIEQSKIVIFGNLQGAFHSLTRCLVKLRELNILTNDFKISSPDHFIIFMGDVVSRSPYSMETLSLVMRLMQTNPDNVIYLKGNHETGNYWQEHTLKTELQIRAAHLSKNTIPLADEVNRFFNTLPLAVYITSLSDPHEVIRISDSGRGQNELLRESNYAKFLSTPTTKKYDCLNVTDKKESNGDTITVKVIFKGEKKRETYQPHIGLRLLEPDMDSTAWTVLSCPTTTYQKAINFKYDAFVVITPAQNIDNWKITLYNRNVQTQDPFKITTYYLLSGTEEGTTKKESHPQTVSHEQPTSALQQIPNTQQQPVKVPQPQPTTIVQQPQPATPIQMLQQPSQQNDLTPQQDLTTTTTIADHAEEISKHAHEIAKHAQEMATQLRKQQPITPQQSRTKQQQKHVDTPSTTAPPQSAFQPIQNDNQDQSNQNNIAAQ